MTKDQRSYLESLMPTSFLQLKREREEFSKTVVNFAPKLAIKAETELKMKVITEFSVAPVDMKTND